MGADGQGTGGCRVQVILARLGAVRKSGRSVDVLERARRVEQLISGFGGCGFHCSVSYGQCLALKSGGVFTLVSGEAAEVFPGQWDPFFVLAVNQGFWDKAADSADGAAIQHCLLRCYSGPPTNFCTLLHVAARNEQDGQAHYHPARHRHLSGSAADFLVDRRGCASVA